MGVELALDAVQEEAREIDQQGVHLGKPAHKDVEAHRGGHGHAQTDGRGDQGFGNARRDGGQGGGFEHADGVERAHDAPDRAEQADEGRGVGRGGQHREGTLQAGQLTGDALTQSPAHIVHHNFAGIAQLLGAVELQDALMGDVVERRSRVGPQRLHGLAQTGGLLETLGAAQSLAAGRAERDELLDHHPPAADGHEHQKRQHGLGHQARLGDHRKKTEFHVVLRNSARSKPFARALRRRAGVSGAFRFCSGTAAKQRRTTDAKKRPPQGGGTARPATGLRGGECNE